VGDFGDCPAYADAALAMDDIRPEAVIVAAATPVHDALARLAIARGIPVLLEKPVTTSVEQGMTLRDAARAGGVHVVPAHNSLHAAGIDELLALPLAPAAIAYVWRRMASSGDTMRTWSRAFLFETIYHVLVVVGRAGGGGVGTVTKVSWRGDAAPQYVRLELRYGDTPAEIVLDFAAPVEEDMLSRRSADAADAAPTWRRQGRVTSITTASGTRPVEARGSDVECMLASFRDVVLGKAEPAATLDEALDVMRTAAAVVDAVAAAGAPFERASAPVHVASRELRQPLREPARSA
jgi:predicted dehydrogenase